MSYFSGVVPLLERWLGNLLARQFEGRVSALAGRVKSLLGTSERVDREFVMGILREVSKFFFLMYIYIYVIYIYILYYIYMP